MKRHITIILFSFIFISCKRENPKWNSEYLVPLIKTSVSIDDITNDTLTTKNDDGSIFLNYRKNISSINLDTLVKVTDLKFSKTSKLTDIQIPDYSYRADITLGMIARSWPGVGPIILASQGQNYPMQNFYGLDTDPYNVNLESEFQSVTLSQGYLDVIVTNSFPVDIANIQYSLKNTSNNSLIAEEIYAYIPVGATETHTIDLSGKTIEGAITARLINLDYLANNQIVLIDTNETVDVELVFRDFVIESATAVFPAQEVINEKVETKLELPEAKLKKAIIEEGNVIIDVISTASDTIIFNYKIPGAVKNNISFETNTIIPPAQPGNSTSVSFNYDFSGYDLDLTGSSGNEKNILYSELIGRIDSTGNMITLSQNDSIKVDLRIENLKPSYVEGFLGKVNYTIGPEEINFDIFKNVTEGNLHFENVSTYFSMENSVGVNGSLKINELTAINSSSNSSLSLVSSELSNPITINKATDNPLTPSISNFLIDNQNSNISELINVMPDKLSYSLEISVNENTDSTNSDYNDFAYLSNTINSSIDMEIPLSFIANDLTLKDTIELSSETLIEFENIESAELNFIVDNGFPLSTEFEVYFMDESNNNLVSFISEDIIKEAPTSNGRVLSPERSVVVFPLTPDDADKISNCSQLLIKAKFNTEGNEYVKIYNDYLLEVTLSGNFNYKNQ